jgi:uncharacterized protein
VIADAEGLDTVRRELLMISAWMHDVGIIEVYAGHELVSCRLMRDVVANDLSSEEISLIEEAIMATEIPQDATHDIARILCDADLLYLGTNLFSDWSDRLRQEHSAMYHRSYSDREWADINIKFIKGHNYFTQFATDFCRSGCAYNLQVLEQH